VKSRIHIGEITVDLERQQILKGDEVQVLPKRVQRLMLYFAANPQRVISKSELHQHVWDSRPVEDSAFSTTVWHVRQLLGDPDRQILRTASRQGYMLTLAKSELEEDLSSVSLTGSSNTLSKTFVESLPIIPPNGSAEIQVSSAAVLLVPFASSQNLGAKRLAIRVFLALIIAAVLLTLFWPQKNVATVWVLREESIDPEVSAFLQLIWTRQLESAGMQLTLKGATNRQPLASIWSQVDVDQNNYTFVLTENGKQQTYSGKLTDSVEAIARTALSEHMNKALSATSELPQGVVNVRLDFQAMQRNLLDKLKTDESSIETLVWLAYAKNELGRYSAARFFAADALTRKSISSESRCVAQYVLIDQSADLSSLAEPSCAIARIRFFERQGNIQQARTVEPIDTITRGNPVLALKAMEISLRVGFDATQEQVITEKIQQLETLAKDAGWDAVLPRLYEIKAQLHALRMNSAEQKYWLEEAERGFRRLNDQANGDRIICKQLRMNGILSREEIARVEGYLQPRESSNDPRLKFACELILIKFKTKSEHFNEKATALRLRINQLPLNYERLEALFGLISQCGIYNRALAIKYSNELSDLSDGYPLMKLRAISQLAQFAKDSQEVVNRFVEVEKIASSIGILEDFTTSWCVASDAAIKVGDFSLANRWAQACTQLPIPSIASCVSLYGVSVRMAINRKLKLPQLNPWEFITGHDDAWQVLPNNCATGFYMIALQIIKSGDLKGAIKYYKDATNDQEIDSVKLYAGLLVAHKCAFEKELCNEVSARIVSENPRFEIYDRGIVFAAVVARNAKQCRKGDLEQLKEFERQEHALLPRFACVWNACRAQSSVCKPLILLGN
jgi:DNA-binding winged helix-turn-helix (wHTH) protein